MGHSKPYAPLVCQKGGRRGKKGPAKPFVTDSVRVPGYEYLEIAKDAGYTHLTLYAPVIMADGIFGNYFIKVYAGMRS